MLKNISFYSQSNNDPFATATTTTINKKVPSIKSNHASWKSKKYYKKSTKNKKQKKPCLLFNNILYIYAEYNFLFLNYAWMKLNILLSFCFSDYYRIWKYILVSLSHLFVILYNFFFLFIAIIYFCFMGVIMIFIFIYLIYIIMKYAI